MALLVMVNQAQATDVQQLRRLAAFYNITAILVFGDSSVDPGNNNHIPTTFKGNFPPYGKDFFHGQPTGRFSNGRLATDFVAEELGFSSAIPAFLDPSKQKADFLHGVSFASAATGYDDLTATLTNVLSFSKQIELLLRYKIELKKMVGEKRGEQTVKNAVFVISAGSNDFIQNYYVEPTRSKQFTVEQYVEYLMTCITTHIKKMHRLGGSRFIVIGIPPLGCMPLVKTVGGSTGCLDISNQAAMAFNSKLKTQLLKLKKTLGVRIAYGDSYRTVMNAIQTPSKYGFTVVSKGCCGTGLIEYGDSCRNQSTCTDPSKYVFWDAVHPTQSIYKLLAHDILISVIKEILS